MPEYKNTHFPGQNLDKYEVFLQSFFFEKILIIVGFPSSGPRVIRCVLTDGRTTITNLIFILRKYV